MKKWKLAVALAAMMALGWMVYADEEGAAAPELAKPECAAKPCEGDGAAQMEKSGGEHKAKGERVCGKRKGKCPKAAEKECAREMPFDGPRGRCGMMPPPPPPCCGMMPPPPPCCQGCCRMPPPPSRCPCCGRMLPPPPPPCCGGYGMMPSPPCRGPEGRGRMAPPQDGRGPCMGEDRPAVGEEKPACEGKKPCGKRPCGKKPCGKKRCGKKYAPAEEAAEAPADAPEETAVEPQGDGGEAIP